jgi:hypothetical protein
MELTYKGNFIINDEIEFAPKSLTVNYESLSSDNSGRTLDGVMHIYWVFNRIRKLEIEMAPTTADKIAQLFSRVQGKTYDIKYWDILENAEKTITVYTSNSHADCYSGRVRDGLYQGVKFNAIEIAGELDDSVAPIVPTINTIGELVIENNTADVFATSGNDLIVEVNTDGVSYSIDEEGDLWRVS